MIPFAALLAQVEDLMVGASIDVDDSLDLAAASLEEDDPVLERSRLVSRGFLHGRHRRWIANEPAAHMPTMPAMPTVPTVLSLTVHEFAMSAQAELSLADLRERLRAAAIADLRASARSLIAAYRDDDSDQLACASRVTGVYQVIVAMRSAALTGAPSHIDIASMIADRQVALLNDLR